MADGFVQVLPDSTGKRVDTSEITVGGQTVERQRTSLGDPVTPGALAAVLNAAPGAAAYGLVTRPLALNFCTQFNENAGNANVSANATFNGAVHDLGDLSSGGPSYGRWRVFVYADQPGTVKLSQSLDNATFYITQSQPVTALAPLIVESMVCLRYLQATFTAGTNPTATFRFASTLVAV